MMVLHLICVPGADPLRDAMVRTMMTQTQVCLHPDTLRRGVVWNWAQAMECINSQRDTRDWHVVVQDDMVLLPGWQNHLRRACQYSPRPLLGLMWVQGQFALGVENNRPYVVGPNTLRGGAVAYHQSLFPQIADFAHQLEATDYPNDDVATSYWAQTQQGFHPAVVSRSLFGSPQVKSLLRHYYKYDEPCYTIGNTDGPDWADTPRFIYTDHAHNKSDEKQFLEAMSA